MQVEISVNRQHTVTSPDDLRRYRDRIERGSGVPTWMVIARGDIVSRGFGPTQWRGTIWPKVKSLVR